MTSAIVNLTYLKNISGRIQTIEPTNGTELLQTLKNRPIKAEKVKKNLLPCHLSKKKVKKRKKVPFRFPVKIPPFLISHGYEGVKWP